LALVALLRGDTRVLLLLTAVLVCVIGHIRMIHVDAAPPLPLAALTGTHEVTGSVRADALVDGSVQRIDVDVRTVGDEPMDGGIRLRARLEGPGDAPLRAGDRIRFTATLEPPPRTDAYDYAEYLRDRDIVLVASFPSAIVLEGREDLGWRGALLELRRRMVARIEAALSEPAAALAAGVLVGERSALPEDIDDALRATGTTHLVVVSGQNVALLIGILVAVLTSAVSRRVASLGALAVLPAYVVFVGADPPVVRAAIMAVAVVAAGVTGRRTPGWTYLAYAVAAMLLVEPSLARDVAFQLSATATAGVSIVAPALRDAVLAGAPSWSTPRRAALVGIASTATGAAIAVLPVQVAAFDSIAPWTIVANILVAPLYEATVAAAALAALTGGTLGGASAAVAVVPQTFLALVQALAALPYAEVPIRLPLATGIVFVLALSLLTTWLSGRRSAVVILDPARSPAPVLTVAIAVVTVGLWAAALAPTPALASVTVLDVGQGLAVLVRDGDRTLLIDTGPPDDAVLAALGEERVGRVDAVVITHTDIDHAGGLDALRRRMGVTRVLAEPSTLALIEGSAEPLDIGDQIHVGSVAITVLGPPVATRSAALDSDNNGSLVLMLAVGDRRLLVTGDAEAAAEAWLVSTALDLRADVLVVGHHGSDTSTTPAFLEAVSPAVAVIPVGSNAFGHPHEDVLTRLGAIEVYRTDEHGNVTFRSDGSGLWVEADR